jgi:hypothetical protein
MNIHQALQKQLPSNDGTYELIVGMPEEGAEYSFSRSGCDLIDTLACDTVEVDCAVIRRNIAGRIIECSKFSANVCGEVLDAMANGSNYFQDARGDWVHEYDFKFKK